MPALRRAVTLLAVATIPLCCDAFLLASIRTTTRAAAAAVADRLEVAPSPFAIGQSFDTRTFLLEPEVAPSEPMSHVVCRSTDGSALTDILTAALNYE